MIYFKEGGFTPYAIKAVFNDSGKEVVQYTDDKESIEEMVQKFARMSGLRFEPNVLTQEQQDRLDTLNSLAGLNGLYQAEPLLFVEHGVIYLDTECPFLLPIEPDYRVQTDKYIAKQQGVVFKKERQAQLDNAVVTTQSGKQFDADEASIIRLGNALVAADGEPEDTIIKWSLANDGAGVMTDCTKSEVREAHKLAMENMSAIWSV